MAGRATVLCAARRSGTFFFRRAAAGFEIAVVVAMLSSVGGGPGAPSAGALRHASAAGAAGPDSAAGTKAAPARVVLGPQPRTAGARALELTSNWAGLVDNHGPFTSVAATWTVPAVQPSPLSQVSATWVGLDGASPTDSTIIQAGTTQATVAGQTSYFAWYELYPLASVVVGNVSPGDVVHVAIAQVGPGSWSIAVDDRSSGQGFTTTAAYAGPALSAEWIEEAPLIGGQLSTLADFGSVGFQAVTVDGSPPTAVDQIDMVGPAGATIAAPTSAGASGGSFAVSYVQSGASSHSGYDLVGSDGGVFVFPEGQSGGYYGSLPGLGVSVHDVVGMVPSPDDRGYFLVGSDGGVFAFGDAPFEGSLPGLGVHVGDIRGIVPTGDNRGYFLVGSDGGVFAFGDAQYLGSLPGRGIGVSDVIGIAATPSDHGYWVVRSDGSIDAFGDAPALGSALGTRSAVSGIAATPDGGGYWVVTQNGSTYPFGDAGAYGSLPALGIAPARPVIGLVPTADDQGYWLIGSDGGIFAFGDAPFVGSLPGLRVHVGDIVGAVPTQV